MDSKIDRKQQQKPQNILQLLQSTMYEHKLRYSATVQTVKKRLKVKMHF